MAPRVTALVAERRDRVRVELDGEPWRTLPASAVIGAFLVVGTELTRERARELRRHLRRIEAVELATRALAHRDRSAASVDAQLETRGVAPAERRRALRELEGHGYVDDSRFARARAEALAARGYGDEAIRFDLERQGVGPDPAKSALETLPAESQRARALVARHGRTAKSARRLAAKGFSAESIELALGDLESLARVDD